MAQTQSGSYFTGLRDDLTGLAIDYTRARYIDSQTVDDEQNVPDQADQFYNESGRPHQPAPGGVSLSTWMMLGIVAAAGVFVFKRVL